MWGMLFILRPFKQEGIWDNGGLIAGVLWLLLGLMQPLTVVLAWTVIGVFLTILIVRHLYLISGGQVPDKQTWKSYLWRVIISIVISCPIVIYTFLAFNNDAYFKGWIAQNVILSPHPLHYLLAYGLLLPFAILGIYRVFIKGEVPGYLLAGWLVIFPILVYIPYTLQRRLAEGICVVIVILSVKAVEVWQDNRVIIWRIRLFKTANILLFPSTLLLFLGGLFVIGQPSEPIFRPIDEVSVFLFLSQHSTPGGVVLTSFETGNALPAWAPLRVVIGHGPESVGLSELNRQVTAFYDHNTPDTARVDLISDLYIRYVFWGPNERYLAIQVNHQPWDPHQAYYLKEINRSGDYTVFEVIQ
jgi:glycopeptide antibiotics resistance protein